MGTIHLGKNARSPALVLERGLSYLTCLAKTAGDIHLQFCWWCCIHHLPQPPALSNGIRQYQSLDINTALYINLFRQAILKTRSLQKASRIKDAKGSFDKSERTLWKRTLSYNWIATFTTLCLFWSQRVDAHHLRQQLRLGQVLFEFAHHGFSSFHWSIFVSCQLHDWENMIDWPPVCGRRVRWTYIQWYCGVLVIGNQPKLFGFVVHLHPELQKGHFRWD